MASICFKKLDSSIVEYDAEMKNYSTFNIGGKVLAVLKPRTKNELIGCVQECKKYNIKYQVIGNGSNLLFSSKKSKMVFITTRFMDEDIKVDNCDVYVSAGVNINKLIYLLSEYGIGGIEELYGIPATVGGMVMMNAGAFNKYILDNVEKVEVLDDDQVYWIQKKDIEYSHHYTNLLKSNKIIISVLFKLEKYESNVIKSKCKDVVFKRKEKQPDGKSAGSVFRTTDCGKPAGLLIDQAGLKGVRVFDAEVSVKHANFIINKGSATDKNVKKLVKMIQNKIKKKFNVNLEREIEYIGERYGYYR